jgi:hypothetical protein
VYYPPPSYVTLIDSCYYADNSACYYGSLLPSRVSPFYSFGAGLIYGAEGGRYLNTVAGLLVSSDGGITWKRAP